MLENRINIGETREKTAKFILEKGRSATLLAEKNGIYESGEYGIANKYVRKFT